MPDEAWGYEIGPGLTAGVALAGLRFYLAALDAAGIALDDTGVAGWLNRYGKSDEDYEPRRWLEFCDNDLLQIAVGLILSGVLEQ